MRSGTARDCRSNRASRIRPSYGFKGVIGVVSFHLVLGTVQYSTVLFVLAGMTECHYVQETCAQELRGNRFNKACDLIDIVKHVWELGVGIPTASWDND